MKEDSKKFFHRLLTTPSITGYEQMIQRVVRSRMEQYADLIEIDLHGNLIAAVNPKAERKVMLAGHCDQIGFMVRHIADDGYLYLIPVGGIDTGVLPGAHVTVHSESGKIQGVIGRKAIHLQKPEERSAAKIEMENVWVDIGAKDRKEAEKKVQIGDRVTFKLEVTELGKDLVCSPGIDNKAGLFVVMEALRLCAKAKLSVGVYAVSTVAEEIGLRGAQTAAYGINPIVGIGVDVTHSNDNPAYSEKKMTVRKLGGGPTIVRGPSVNPVVEKRLIDAAKKGKIPYQLEPCGGTLGNDTNVMQVTRAGVATGCIGIPNRYMHSQVEVCHLTDLENAAKIIARFVQEIGPRTDFRPH